MYLFQTMTKCITLRDTCSFIHMFVFIKSIFAFKGVDLGYPKIFPSFIFIPLFCSFHCFARAYLQTGYSDMLDISYLFNNNTLKCIKANVTLKNRHIDIIAPNLTNFYR
jgi:hypothetical protein